MIPGQGTLFLLWPALLFLCFCQPFTVSGSYEPLSSAGGAPSPVDWLTFAEVDHFSRREEPFTVGHELGVLET